MKNLKYVLALTLSAAAVVSCQENADMAAIEMPAQGEAIILTATAPATPATRIVENVTADGIEFSWFGGDQYNQPDRISVYNVETGAKVGNFGINERNGAKETATFSPIGPGDPDKMSYEAVYAAADFNLVAGVEYIAVFPASDSETFDARNAETITAEQWQAQKGGWRYNARMVSNKFTTANTSLTFTHENAFMAFDFIVPDGKAVKSFICTAGETSSIVLINGYNAAQSKYTANFAMYPTTEDKLTFTITDIEDKVTKVVRNISSEVKAGYYYKQTLVEESFVASGDSVYPNGDFSTPKSDATGWNIVGINQYSGGITSASLPTEGKDGTMCVKYVISEAGGEYGTQLMFNNAVLQTLPLGLYKFSIDMNPSATLTVSPIFRKKYNAVASVTFDSPTISANEWTTLEGYVNISTEGIEDIAIDIAPLLGGTLMFDNFLLIPGTLDQTMKSDE